MLFSRSSLGQTLVMLNSSATHLNVSNWRRVSRTSSHLRLCWGWSSCRSFPFGECLSWYYIPQLRPLGIAMTQSSGRPFGSRGRVLFILDMSSLWPLRKRVIVLRSLYAEKKCEGRMHAMFNVKLHPNLDALTPNFDLQTPLSPILPFSAWSKLGSWTLPMRRA